MFVKEVTTGLITHSGLNNVLEDETRNLWNYDTKRKISIILLNLHWCPIGSYSSDDPQQKSKSSTAKAQLDIQM